MRLARGGASSTNVHLILILIFIFIFIAFTLALLLVIFIVSSRVCTISAASSMGMRVLQQHPGLDVLGRDREEALVHLGVEAAVYVYPPQIFGK